MVGHQFYGYVNVILWPKVEDSRECIHFFRKQASNHEINFIGLLRKKFLRNDL